MRQLLAPADAPDDWYITIKFTHILPSHDCSTFLPRLLAIFPVYDFRTYVFLTSAASQAGGATVQPQHPSRLTLLLFGVVLTHFGLALAQKCYFTGQKTVADGYTPCNTSAIAHGGGTACCANGEACLTSGLCYMIFDMSINIGAWTDSSWNTTKCFQKCPSDYGNANTNNLYRCSNNQWCCSRGGNTTSCCNDPNVASFFPQGTNTVHQIYNGSAFAAGFALSPTSVSTSSASASTAKADGAKSTATRASGDACPTTGVSRNNNTCPNMTYNSAETNTVGVGVGVGLCVPLLTALAASLLLWAREKKRSRDFQDQAAVAGQQLLWRKPSMGFGSVSGGRVDQQTSHEVPGLIEDYGAAEMMGSDGRREMATSPMANGDSIVFVHGLRGHPRHTWEQELSPREDEGEKVRSNSRLFSWRSHKRSTSSVRAENESAQSNAGTTYWPQDLLPRTIPTARILTYGYDADIIGGLFKGASKNNITQHAQDLMLKLEREVEGEPIIFVAHSLGGILVKEGLHWSKSHISPRYQQLRQSTKNVIFLGVPHRGSETLARLANVSLRDTNRHLIRSLEVEDELLDRIHFEFVKMVQLEDFSVYSFQESSGLSGLKGFSGKVVSDSSSKLDHPLEIVETIRGNHMEMARFSDANDEGYRTVSKVIARCVTDIQQHEKRDKPTTGNTLDNVSPATKGKRYIRIPYISNNDFIGREKELLWLQAHLENQASNEEQHRVAVWGPGGAGKTQLVSTYAFRNQSKYSAIFWVTASSDITLRKTYADIAKYLDLALPSGGDQQTAIDSVRDWFTDHQQGDWLLVIDNADNLDEVDIHTVIPPINNGSVIITSRNRQAAGFGPAIEIGEMDAGDAVALLFRRAAIYHPAPMEEITGAEIAKSLGYLALAIEHAGAYVQSVGGTLQEYLQQFQDDRRDTLDKSPAFSMHKESVVQTFNMSFKAVMERNMAAAKLLCFMGFLDAEGVLQSLILSTDERITIFRDEVMSGPKEFRDGIQVLTSFSLIRVKSEAEKKSISLHPLVHYLSRARLNVENQWRWKGRVTIWLVQLSVAANADTVYFPHVREQMQQMTEIKSSPADIQKRRSVYYCLALLMNHYRFAWQNLGAMDELHKYSEMVMEVVEEDLEDQEHLSIVAAMALIEVQIITVQFISSDSTYDQIVLRYVLKQMTPLAKKALENARDSQKKSNTSSNHASTAMSLPSEDDVKQDGLLSLHALTTALTQTVDAGSLVKVNLAQNDVQATQGSKAITSRDETSKHTPEVGDGLGQCEFSSIPSHDPVPTDQKPGNETLSQLESPVVNEQTTKKYEDSSLTSPSTTEPATDSLSFKPKHLSDVFLSVTPPIRVQCIQGSLGILIKVYHSHHRTAEADLLTTYSTLPVDSAEPADPLTLQISQLFIEASRLAAAQDLDGLLSIYPKIISIAPGSMEATYISLDYAIILNKLHRPAEADRVIRQILYSKPTTQSSEPMKLDQDLARDQPNAYVWLKKILSTSQRLQHHLDQSLQTLLITAQTAQAVFGTNSLSYYHTAFLLYRFYSCHHPQSHSNLECPREADKYWEISVSVLENLYCRGTSGGKQVCSVEGLHMGVMLWAQGALEETVGGFDAFAELSGRIMGENDALSRKARRAAAIAKEEWLLMKGEKKEDVLRFGTIVFPRKIEDLALLLED